MEFSTVPNPIFIPMEFAKNGIKNVIQKVRQSGQDAQDMTWNDGTPPITLTKLEDGGQPPKGQDFNGTLYTISSHTVFGQNGGRYKFDSSVITEFGGYAKDAIIQSNDGLREYISLVDNNTNDPNIGGVANVWSIYSGQGSVPLATSTTTGIMRVLNVLTSTDVGSALSAAMGKSLKDIFDRFYLLPSVNGYVRVPFGSDNLTIQWGVFAGNGTNVVTGNFPVRFQNRAFVSMGSFSDNSQSLSVTVNFEHVGSDSWRAYVSNTNPSFRYSYISIGQ